MSLSRRLEQANHEFRASSRAARSGAMARHATLSSNSVASDKGIGATALHGADHVAMHEAHTFQSAATTHHATVHKSSPARPTGPLGFNAPRVARRCPHFLPT